MNSRLILAVSLFAAQASAESIHVTEQKELKEQQAAQLVHAAFKGDSTKVKALLASGVDANVTDQGGKTALINAALQSHTDLLPLLFEHGALASKADRQKTTPLIAAVLSYANNQDVAQIEQMVDVLIAKGADVNAQNIGGQTALMLAANHGLMGVVEKLLKAGASDQIKNGFNQKAIDLVNVNCPIHELLH